MLWGCFLFYFYFIYFIFIGILGLFPFAAFPDLLDQCTFSV